MTRAIDFGLAAREPNADALVAALTELGMQEEKWLTRINTLIQERREDFLKRNSRYENEP